MFIRNHGENMHKRFESLIEEDLASRLEHMTLPLKLPKLITESLSSLELESTLIIDRKQQHCDENELKWKEVAVKKEKLQEGRSVMENGGKWMMRGMETCKGFVCEGSDYVSTQIVN